jgi:tRNA pseudouridine13 synthase
MLNNIYKHSPIKSPIFNKNSENFVVEEKPLYDFSNNGEWLILKIRKKDLTTYDLIKIFSERTGAKSRDIGYAGLKDKYGMTIQYISIPKRFIKEVDKIRHPKIKILEKHIHKNKLQIGHLKGNRFFIRLKKVNPTDAKKLNKILKSFKKYGIPNYFGFQRFGKNNSAKQGKDLIEGNLVIKNKKIAKLLVNAYQSELFNEWLSERINLSKIFEEFTEQELSKEFPKEVIEFVKKQNHPFKLLQGDLMKHYPHGRDFELDPAEIERFEKKDISVTGLLNGKKVKRATKYAGIIEEKYAHHIPGKDGDRRYAWIFPEDIEGKYNEKEWQYNLNFFLPKGSYATVFLELLLNRDVGEM